MTGLSALPERLEGDRVVLEAVAREAGSLRYAVRWRRAPDPVGSVVIEGDPEGPIIRMICIDGGERGFGAGSEAVGALIAALAQAYPRLRAWAPPDLGLAVYFWVRMGFRPVPGDGPDGGLWFERALATSPRA